MNSRVLAPVAFLLAVSTVAVVPAGTAQNVAAGAVDFVATVKPNGGGRAEPVREMSFYLLRKSLADIGKEAEQAEHPIDMEHFINDLQVSPELKEWMKAHHTVQFIGKAFTKQLTADDVVDVPEFFEAYTTQNGTTLGGGAPILAAKEKDKEKNPAKYKKAHDDYLKSLRRYIAANPDTLQGLDIELREKDPGRRWAQIEADQRQRIARRTIEMAQTRYLAARLDTDLNGRGIFNGVPAGSYWITTLDTPALSGDARLQWDLSVSVRPGNTTRIELSNLNALEATNRTIQ
jgi:hypothetical protein